jgi:hypothetical protein
MIEILPECEAAALLRLSPRTLQAWRARGEGPPFIRLGRRRIGYDPRDLETWRQRNRLDPESEPREPTPAA